MLTYKNLQICWTLCGLLGVVTTAYMIGMNIIDSRKLAKYEYFATHFRLYAKERGDDTDTHTLTLTHTHAHKYYISILLQNYFFYSFRSTNCADNFSKSGMLSLGPIIAVGTFLLLGVR